MSTEGEAEALARIEGMLGEVLELLRGDGAEVRTAEEDSPPAEPDLGVPDRRRPPG